MKLFVVPQPLETKVGKKIFSLQDPTKKMSKSKTDTKGTIDLLDDPAVARKKIMSAVTDSVGIIQYDPESQPGLANLLTIQSVLANEPIEDIVKRYEGKGYGELKKEIGQTVFDFLTDLQAKYKKIIESNVIDQILEEGAKKASYVANKKIRKVYKKIGFTITK